MTRRTPVVSFVLLLLAGLLAAHVPASEAKPSKPSKEDDYYELYKILVDTMDQVERNYVKEVDRRELVEAAIQGVLSKLDPYSTYIGPDEISRFRGTVESEFGGIGIQISVEHGQLKVISPLVGTPAYRAGLLAGDRIVEIEGKSTDGLTLDEAVRRLKGKAGTKVNLTVIHPASTDKMNVTITREIVHVATVLGDRRKEDDTWDFILKPEEHIAYLRVTAFSRDTAREMREVIERLQADGLRGLILDLRFNPGGLLSSAIEVCDMFIPQGRIVSTEGRNSPERSWEATKNGTLDDFPMVVLVNRYSASASEIVSACLQDHKRAVVMGERTWGKSSIQNVIELEIDPATKQARSALKLTTASYLRPNGKNIHRFPDSKEDDEWGVMPDKGYLIKLSDAEMVRLIQDRRRRDIVRPKNGEQKQPHTGEEPANDGKPQKPDEDENAAEKPEESETPPPADRQLQKAVEYLTSELARAE